jgi:hypothetical protein
VKQYTVGRTGAGKTSLGNRLFGEEVMSSTGHINCTDYIGLLKMRSSLHYIDTPDAGSDEEYENWARLARGLPQLEDSRRTASGCAKTLSRPLGPSTARCSLTAPCALGSPG